MNLKKMKENLDIYCLNKNNELIDNDVSIELEIKNNGICIPLATIRKGYCSNCEFYDFYVIDYYEDNVTDYVVETELKQIGFQMVDDFDYDCNEISQYGVKIKKINGEYQFIYGILDEDLYEFEEFESGGDIFDFYHINAPLNQKIIELMNYNLSPYLTYEEVKNSYENGHKDLVKIFGVQKFIDIAKKDDVNIAINVLEDHNNDKHYLYQLKECYLKINDETKYLNTLNKLLMEHYATFEDYIEYSKAYNGDWKLKREKIFERYHFRTEFLNKCYYYEKLYTKLISNLKSVEEFAKYYTELKKDYSEELLKRYVKVLRVMEKQVKTPTYYEIGQLLKQMKTIPGGEEIVNSLIDEWRINYKRRRNMMEVLDGI